MDAYVGIAPVSRDEIAVMTAMLPVPQKFWRVANDIIIQKKLGTKKLYRHVGRGNNRIR